VGGGVRRLLRMRELAYSVVDVFAERALEGNPLAVFHDGRSLTDEEMQALAREMNLAETTFVLPASEGEEAEHGVRVRIFTTQEELPFAGHPTLGTAGWLYFNHPELRGRENITLRLKVGPITVRFREETAGAEGVFGTMRQNDPVFGRVHERGAVARAIGMREEDLLEGYAPQTVSTGIPFCVVLLRSVEVARRLEIVQRDAEAWLRESDAKFLYCVAPVEGSAPCGAQWHARMQFYSGEDPATGSAAGCCISWLVAQGLVRPGEETVIEQGIEIRRPSRITARAGMEGSAVTDVRVSGRTIPVARGVFFLP